MQWPNRGDAKGGIAPTPPKMSFLKKFKKKTISFFWHHCRFFPAIIKCYYVPILFKMSIAAAAIVNKKTFKGEYRDAHTLTHD